MLLKTSQMYLLNFAKEMLVDDEAVKMMTSCLPTFEQIIFFLSLELEPRFACKFCILFVGEVLK